MVIKAAILGLLFLSSAYADTDPLFLKMAGHWIGVGTSKGLGSYSGAEHKVLDEVTSNVEIVDGTPALVSKDKYTEFESDGTQRSAELNYWIKPDAQPGYYSLGHLGSSKVLGGGFMLYRSSTFSSNEIIGDWAYSYETVFSGDEVVYTSTTTYNSEPISETTIHFRRAAQ